jgi:2-oxoglutarate dehydrogenase E2 component (dihydrolipoamide succinyltransferase)
MKIEMLMPQMGESITEATISRWLKNLGDLVQKDEIILEISTDKVDSEIPAPASGVLAEVLFKTGDVVPVKTKIAVIDTEKSAASPTEKDATITAAPTPIKSHNINVDITQIEKEVGQSTFSETTQGSKLISPLVKNLAAQHGISLSELEKIAGSNTSGGRITKQDFLNYVAEKENGMSGKISASSSDSKNVSNSLKNIPPTASTTPTAKRDDNKSEQVPTINDWTSDGTKIIPMDRMRQAIAEHMVRSKHTSPHVYSVQEVDVTNLSLWRNKQKDKFQKSEGFNLSFTPFFLLAAVRGIKQYPYLNSTIKDNSIVLKKHINLGCAVALGNSGLIVPVIKKAEELTLVGIARQLNDISLRARDKKLLPDDVVGGTFTVTNPGIFGTIIGTPIINQPQVAILCLGSIEKRPVVINDMIAIRQMCYLTLSYDHRIIDGSLGGQYLAYLKNFLEKWDVNQELS